MNKIVNKIFSFFKRKKQAPQINKKSETQNKKCLHDQMDYDGMGDWGRFPPIKK